MEYKIEQINIENNIIENTPNNSTIDDIIKEIEDEYYKIISKKDISDHKMILCRKTNIISWNIENDVGYMSTYMYSNKENNLSKFPEHLREHINIIYGIGKNFRNEMEKSDKYYEILNKRYDKVYQVLKKHLDENPEYKICIQECSRGLFDYLKKNLQIKHCKFIRQDTANISIGKVKELKEEIELIFNYRNTVEESSKLFELISNHLKKINISNKEYTDKDDLIWKDYLLHSGDLWNDYIEFIIKEKQETYSKVNIKNSEQHDYGHAIFSNKDFIMLPCLSRMLYSNNFIIVDNYDDCVGGFVVKSRGCIGLDLNIINVHLAKGRVGFDYEKITNRDFFSLDFELTRQIDKYLFGSLNDNGILKLINNQYGQNENKINEFKQNFINCFIKKLYEKFIDEIKYTNNSENNIITSNNIKIELNHDCPISIDLNNLKDNIKENVIKKHFLTNETILSVNNYFNTTKKIKFLGDFNDQVENIIGMFLKYYNMKLINYGEKLNEFDNNVNSDNNVISDNNLESHDKLKDIINENNVLISGLVTCVYASERIDHILEIEYIRIDKYDKLEKYDRYVSKLVSNIEMSKYELIKNNNVISWNVNCRNNSIYYFNPRDKLNFDIGLYELDNDIIDKILRNSITYTLGEIKCKKILEEILDNIIYNSEGEITTKIYLQEANFDLIKYLKDNLKFKFAKFVSECITNLHLLDFSSYLTKDHKIKETTNVYYSNIYNNSNKLGYCIFSNTDFTVLPYLINSTIDYKEDKNILDIKINCAGCIDITNNILSINKYIGLDDIVKNGNLELNKIIIESVNKEIFYEDDKDKIENLINSFRNILFTKFLYIIKDYNYESSTKLNDYIEVKTINYFEHIQNINTDIFQRIYLTLLTEESFEKTNEYFEKNNINKLIILGNYYKSKRTKDESLFKPRFSKLNFEKPIKLNTFVHEPDLFVIQTFFKKRPNIENIKNSIKITKHYNDSLFGEKENFDELLDEI